MMWAFVVDGEVKKFYRELPKSHGNITGIQHLSHAELGILGYHVVVKRPNNIEGETEIKYEINHEQGKVYEYHVTKAAPKKRKAKKKGVKKNV